MSITVAGFMAFSFHNGSNVFGSDCLDRFTVSIVVQFILFRTAGILTDETYIIVNNAGVLAVYLAASVALASSGICFCCLFCSIYHACQRGSSSSEHDPGFLDPNLVLLTVIPIMSNACIHYFDVQPNLKGTCLLCFTAELITISEPKCGSPVYYIVLTSRFFVLSMGSA
nr:hypothetical protein GOBAR_AA24713 [Ipomoea batatas]